MSFPASQVNERAHLFAIAGLLHDVGKVLEAGGRADVGRDVAASFAPASADAPARSACLHAALTDRLLSSAKSRFGGLDGALIRRLAARHHAPTSGDLDEQILSRANRLAHGRSSNQSPQAAGTPYVLREVLAFVRRESQPAGSADAYRPAMLGFDEAAFLPQPGRAAPSPTDLSEIESAIRRELDRDFSDPVSASSAMLAMAVRTMNSISAGVGASAASDVSLLDHSRVVAAFAACLAAQFPAARAGEPAGDIAGRYMVVGYAVGGIQDYIFRNLPTADSDAGDKGRAKTLRAKSFYVSLLSMLVGRRILLATGMPATNLLIDAGGRGTILLPDTPQCREALDAADIAIRRWFRQHFAGTLRFDIARVLDLTDQSFERPGLATTLLRIADALDRAKVTFTDPDLLGPDGWRADGWVQQRTGLAVDSQDARAAMKNFGQALPKAQYISLDGAAEAGSLLEGSGGAHDVLGFAVRLHSGRPTKGERYALSLDPDISCPLLITGNYVPIASERTAEIPGPVEDDDDAVEPGQPIPFSTLARLATADDGTPVEMPMLGVLKADVDRLGLTFAYGLGKNVSLPRLAAMSRSLDYFFKGFLTDRLASRYTSIYTVFSGGDDLFLVGPWYDTVRFLVDLHAWFGRKCADNRGLTFSAGLVFTKPGTPVRQLASLSEAALERSKSGGRDRVTIAGSTMQWPALTQTLSLHDIILRCLEAEAEEDGDRSTNASLVYRLMQYGQMAQRVARAVEEERAPSLADLKWRAQLAYDLRRNLPIHDGTPPDSPRVQLHKALLPLRDADGPMLRIASMLTLYRIRGARS